MKYARQTQDALDRLDGSLRILRDLIKRGQNQDAIRFMEEGELKERFEELRSMILLSNTNNLGASGVSNLGAL
tara:strand:- start:184 stop:402 length:219 start_codon:yes stop_codon:yes gene_type:complete